MPNQHGHPEIDIIEAFRKCELSSLQSHPGESVPGVVLPPSICKPLWENMSKVRKTILLAARKVGIDMVCNATHSDKHNKKKGTGKHFVIGCICSRTSKAFEKKVEEHEKAGPRVSDCGIALAHYDCSHTKQQRVTDL